MKIKISKSQWAFIGKKAGWVIDEGNPKMMPEEKPYTDEERHELYKLVGDAADGDPGEEAEGDYIFHKMMPIKVTFDDGDVIYTSINGTKKEIVDYYFNNDFTKSDETTTHRGVKIDFMEAHPTKPGIGIITQTVEKKDIKK